MTARMGLFRGTHTNVTKLPAPGEVWSLWDMHNFGWGSSFALLSNFGAFVAASSHNLKYAAENAHIDSSIMLCADEHKSDLIKHLEYAELQFSCLGSPHIDQAIQFAKRRCRNEDLSWSEFNTIARRVRDSIDVELKEHLFYRYPRDKGNKLSSHHEDWIKINQSFPDVDADALAATDCYAMGQNTASVFHSMRVAERGLRALAVERRIKLAKNKPVEWGNWQEIIRALDAAIMEFGKKKPGPAKDNALSFYSGALSDLNGFKDEYRNAVMHVREMYDENQALRALDNVRHFMKRLSNKISHNKKRIRWGI